MRLTIEGARLIVDRVETLGLLQREAKTLERAFEQAGLKSSEGGIDLTLRDHQPEGRGQGRNDERFLRRETPFNRPDGGAGPDVSALPPPTLFRAARGVDLRI